MDVDVAIIGGGLAGATLARQLRRTVPGLEIAVFERREETSWKVGESTVELATNYLSRRLGLTNYFYEHHLPKNGLRFFFDTERRDGEIHELSEIGSDGLPLIPSYQIDRARLEADLQRMNRADGVHFETGVRVRELDVGDGDERHEFAVDDGSQSRKWSARWLVDASGRTRVVQKALDMPMVDIDHGMASVWGRFRNVVDIDTLGPTSWHERVRHTSRYLSTNHFLYPGYWIWFIPIKEGVVSVGLVIEKRLFDDGMRTEQGFLKFLREHRAVATLLEGAQMLDIMSYGSFSYGTTRFFGTGRWGLTGEAAAFPDPFYSPGSDFIALENDFMADLIRRDHAGEATAERAELYDQFMKFRFDATMLLYRDLYSTFGSYRLLKLKWDLDIACYYNLWVHPYFRDDHLDAEFLADQLKQGEFVMQALRNFRDLFKHCEQVMRERGDYYEGNTGEFFGGLQNIDFEREVGADLTRKQVLKRTGRYFNLVREGALELLATKPPAEPYQPLPLFEFLLDRSLA